MQDETTAQDASKLGRRSLVRAGATAAWAVPVVGVVAATPAFAATCSTATTADISVSATSSSGSGTHTWTVTVTIANAGLLTSGLIVTASQAGGGGASATLSTVPTGWTKVGTTSAKSPTQISCSGSLSGLTFVVATGRTISPSHVVTLTFAPGNGPTKSVSLS